MRFSTVSILSYYLLVAPFAFLSESFIFRCRAVLSAGRDKSKRENIFQIRIVPQPPLLLFSERYVFNETGSKNNISVNRFRVVERRFYRRTDD